MPSRRSKTAEKLPTYVQTDGRFRAVISSPMGEMNLQGRGELSILPGTVARDLINHYIARVILNMEKADRGLKKIARDNLTYWDHFVDTSGNLWIISDKSPEAYCLGQQPEIVRLFDAVQLIRSRAKEENTQVPRIELIGELADLAGDFEPGTYTDLIQGNIRYVNLVIHEEFTPAPEEGGEGEEPMVDFESND